ncbi:MAG: aldo/keto reductase [Gammaproteobacteria bacterium RIFCSPLOWO2_02_FULL_61_13]|nr:MAG: aldo/keto reductase [Gammaproteobacteria bacterium RIFCSPLOWO2_02_FULL_61_13]
MAGMQTLLGVGYTAEDGSPLLRAIPKTGQLLPAIGMGTWITFQVGDDPQALAERREILRTFLERGGAMLDSSPMYGRAEAVLGQCLRELHFPANPFRATKVWILGRRFGINQMAHSEQLWGEGGFELMQVHNLLDWDAHLPTLREWKAAGRIRYLGVTTSHGRRHEELEQIMRTEELDFVQFTYNIVDREAEERLLPLAAERGIAVIINRPFEHGALFEHVRGRPLPGWTAEIGCRNWAQVFLKFIVSHPAVTCAIPATSQAAHMAENIAALHGALPDSALRRRMAADFAG